MNTIPKGGAMGAKGNFELPGNDFTAWRGCAGSGAGNLRYQQDDPKRLCDEASCLSGVNGQRVLSLPADWTGLPINLFPIPGYATIGPAKSLLPIILCALDGYGDRVYKIHGENYNLRTEPGLLEIYGSGFSWDEAIWCGAPGVCVSVEFHPEIVQRITKTSINFDLMTSHEVIDSRMNWLILELLAEARSGKQANMHYVESISSAIIWLARERYCSELDLDIPGKRFSRSIQNRLEKYLENNISRPISVGEMAACVFLSKFHFTRRFQATYGVSPHRYLLRLRLSRAQDFLAATQMPIGQVANSVGFASSTAFATAFRKYCGITPTQARSQ